jgi:hypothetical protein
MPGQATAELVATSVFHAKLQQTVAVAFEELFHRLMFHSEPGYVPVRLSNDHGADGLNFWNGTVYACYGSTTADSTKVVKKFREDFQSACRQRRGEFTHFVFVHNDSGGADADLTHAMAQAADEEPDVQFTIWVRLSLTERFLALEPHQQRRVIQQDLDVELLPRVGIEHVSDLLGSLTERVNELDPDDLSAVPVPKWNKLDFNEITGWERKLLRDTWKHLGLVDAYYRGHRDELAEDRAARALSTRYAKLRDDGEDPDSIVVELRTYVAGAGPSGAKLMAAYTVLAYFLQTCHIFENPPDSDPTAPVGSNSHAAA